MRYWAIFACTHEKPKHSLESHLQQLARHIHLPMRTWHISLTRAATTASARAMGACEVTENVAASRHLTRLCVTSHGLNADALAAAAVAAAVATNNA
mmetsp:Transcript_31998/g.71098  ORF Transcript_31998/g.71098 Transcript_31998/m.71098 type:complete len:97 (-) Transcript_31998:261-551(-)